MDSEMIDKSQLNTHRALTLDHIAKQLGQLLANHYVQNSQNLSCTVSSTLNLQRP